MKISKKYLFFISLVWVTVISIDCTFHYSYGKIGFIGMDRTLTVQTFQTDSVEEVSEALIKDGNIIQEYCIAGFEQTKNFIESADFSEDKYSFIGIYSGQSLKTPKVLGIFSRSCYAFIAKERRSVSVHHQ